MALLTNLKTYREKYNLKQADLAELVGVRRETIVNLERQIQSFPKAGYGYRQGFSHNG